MKAETLPTSDWRHASGTHVTLVCSVCGKSRIVTLPLSLRALFRFVRRFRDQHAKCEKEGASGPSRNSCGTSIPCQDSAKPTQGAIHDALDAQTPPGSGTERPQHSEFSATEFCE